MFQIFQKTDIQKKLDLAYRARNDCYRDSEWKIMQQSLVFSKFTNLNETVCKRSKHAVIIEVFTGRPLRTCNISCSSEEEAYGSLRVIKIGSFKRAWKTIKEQDFCIQVSGIKEYEF